MSMPPNNNRVGAGFTEGELQFANFWVRNRILLRQIGYGTLIAVNVLSWGYALWGIIDAYAISYDRESRITQDIIQNQFLATQLQANRPQDVDIATVNVFQGTDKRLDFVVGAKNPNTEWWATFTYRFNVGGEVTPKRIGFILPGQTRYLGEFGFTPTSAGARTGVLVVDEVRWHRVEPAQVGDDYAAWLERHDQFRADDVQFRVEQLPGAKRLSRSSFTFVNPSAYGFWQVELYVVLKRGTSPVAATAVTLDRVLPGESRPINIDWFESLPGVTATEIVPVVNLLDESSFISTTQL
jgi:hypothetical protein